MNLITLKLWTLQFFFRLTSTCFNLSHHSNRNWKMLKTKLSDEKTTTQKKIASIWFVDPHTRVCKIVKPQFSSFSLFFIRFVSFFFSSLLFIFVCSYSICRASECIDITQVCNWNSSEARKKKLIVNGSIKRFSFFRLFHSNLISIFLHVKMSQVANEQ